MIEFLLFIIAALVVILLAVIYKLSGVSSAYDAQSELVRVQKVSIIKMAKLLKIDHNLPKEYFQ